MRFPLPMKRAAFLLGATALLAGCAAMPDLGARPSLRDAGTLGSIPSEPAGQWPGDGWWKDYGDAQLSALIEEGLAGSPTLAIADARAKKAAGYATGAGAALLPSLTANGQVTEVKQSYNNGFPRQFVPKGFNDSGRFTLDLNYELDFFGKNRAALRAVTSEREAALIEARAARLALATSIAAAYADLARLAAQREVDLAAVKQREEVAALVARRVVSGLDTRGEQRQADAAVPLARGDLAATEEAIELTRNRLAALIGAGPERGAKIALPSPRALPAPGLPSNLALDLVGRRADIAAARLRAEAASSRITVARAGFYPNVNLMGFIGLQSLGLGNLTANGSDIGEAGAAVSLPIFSGGRIEGNYRTARADYDEAVAQYDQTLVRALNEVADVAASQRALATRQAEAHAALAASEEAYAIARRRYEGGLSPYLSVLTAQDALLRNRQLVAALDARALTLNVELIRALGGGFSTKA